MITRNMIFEYVMEKYGTTPDYPWDDMDAAVLRKPSKKWYGLVMSVRRSAVGLDGENKVDIINLKCSPLIREILIGEGKAVPAYHMNKRLWLSIPLTDRISETELKGAIDDSYEVIK